MRILWAWIQRYGIPVSIYCDCKNVHITEREPTVQEQLAGKEPLTAFGLACQKLGIETSLPTLLKPRGGWNAMMGYTGRFVKELRLKGIKSIDGGQQVVGGWIL